MKRLVFVFIFTIYCIICIGQELDVSEFAISNKNTVFNSYALDNCILTIPAPIEPEITNSTINYYQALYNQLTTSTLKNKITLVSIPGSIPATGGEFPITSYKFVKVDASKDGGFDNSGCVHLPDLDLLGEPKRYLNYFIGDLEAVKKVEGPFSSFRPSNVSNGLFLLTHSDNVLKDGDIPCINQSNNLFINNRLHLLRDRFLIPIRSFKKVSSAITINPTLNELNTRFYIFRDLLMSGNERSRYDKYLYPSSLNYSLQSSYVSNMTYYRFYFKVNGDLAQSEIDLYSNFKLFTNESTEIQSQCPDLFSIRIADFTGDDGTCIPIPHYDIVSPGFYTLPNYSLNPPKGFQLVENSPRVFRQGIVMDDLNRLKVGNPIMGFKYETRLMSYKYTLKKDHLYSIIIGIADVGTRGPGEVSGLMVQLSDSPSADYLPPNEPECDPLSFATSNPCCNTGFSPYILKEYLLQGWVKNTGSIIPKLTISFEGSNQDVLGTPLDYDINNTAIDGWIKVNARFLVPASASKVKFSFSNNSVSTNSVYVDDLRIIPVNSEAKSFVVDALTRKPIAEFDSENNGTYFIYNTDGTLIQTKKETSKGVRTLTVTTGNE